MPKRMIVLASGLLLLSAAGLAQSKPESAVGQIRSASSLPEKTLNVPAGTSLFVLTIGAWDMQPIDSSKTTGTVELDSGNLLRNSTAAGGTALVGHIHLPAGALIDHTEVDACRVRSS